MSIIFSMRENERKAREDVGLADGRYCKRIRKQV